MKPFNKDWFEKHQAAILWLINNPILKYWLRRVLRIDTKDKVCRILPHAYFIFLGKKKANYRYKGNFRTHDKFAKRIYYAFKPAWLLLHLWDMVVANSFVPNLNLGFDSFTFLPDANPESTSVDGNAARSVDNQTWVQITTGAGNASAGDSAGACDAAIITAGTNVNTWKLLGRAFFLFDTSTLNDNTAIFTADLSLSGFGKNANTTGDWNMDLNVYSATPASNTAIVATDYLNVGSAAFSSPIAITDWNTSGYNRFHLNGSGISNISKTGVSKFSTRNANYDVAAAPPTYHAGETSNIISWMADKAGTSDDPKLVIEYETDNGYAYFM